MSYSLTRRHFLATLLSTSAMPLIAQETDDHTDLKSTEQNPADQLPKSRDIPPPIVPELSDILESHSISKYSTLCIMDCETGKVLESHNPDQMRPPASVVKLITAGYALENLGGDFRFETEILTTGPLRKGVIQGDLILVGGADPQLNTDQMAGMVDALIQNGIKGITGEFLVYDRTLPYQAQIDPSQPVFAGYNPSISGLNFNFNRVYLQWKLENGNYKTSFEAHAEKYKPLSKQASIKIVPREKPLFTYERVGEVDEWSLSSFKLKDAGSRWLPVRQPANYAAETFRTLARDAGLKLPKWRFITTVPKGQIMAHLESPRLRHILQAMLRYSTNMTAETVGLFTSVTKVPSITSTAGSADMMGKWMHERTTLQGGHLSDHSGLNVSNELSAKQMVSYLKTMQPNGQLKSLMRIFERRNTQNVKLNARMRIEAKTGTLYFVRCLSGYMSWKQKPYAFAIFTSDLDARDAAIKKNPDKPKGTGVWIKRAKAFEQEILRRWDATYSA